MSKNPKTMMAEVILAAVSRNEKIYLARTEAGLTYEQIGKLYGLSRQRIEVIVKRLGRERDGQSTAR